MQLVNSQKKRLLSKLSPHFTLMTRVQRLIFALERRYLESCVILMDSEIYVSEVSKGLR